MRSRFGFACVAVLASGCVEEGTPLERGDSVEVVGHFERVDGGLWVGTETVTVVERDGTLVCEDGWDMEAEEWDVQPTLDVVRATVRQLAESCQPVYEVHTLTTTWPALLTFESTIDKDGLDRGRVLVSSSAEGPWAPYAIGFSDDDTLTYHRSVSVDALGDDRTVAADPIDRLHGPHDPPFTREP